MAEETKKCSFCGEEKPLAMFSRRGRGYQGYCKDCATEYKRALRAEKKAKVAENTIVTEEGKTLHRVSANCKPLEEYQPRELLAELKRRGYIWDNMFIYTKQRVEYDKI